MKTVTKNDCLTALRLTFNHYKRNFSANEYNKFRTRNSFFPNYMTIISKFNSWNNAKREAGIDISENVRNSKKIEQITINGVISEAKTCSKCLNIKPLNEFHKCPTGLGGRHSKCKECYNEYKRNHHHQNKEQMNLKSRAYYLENKESIKMRQKRNQLIKQQISI